MKAIINTLKIQYDLDKKRIEKIANKSNQNVTYSDYFLYMQKSAPVEKAIQKADKLIKQINYNNKELNNIVLYLQNTLSGLEEFSLTLNVVSQLLDSIKNDENSSDSNNHSPAKY